MNVVDEAAAEQVRQAGGKARVVEHSLAELKSQYRSAGENPASFQVEDCRHCGSCMFCKGCDSCYRCTHCEGCDSCSLSTAPTAAAASPPGR